MSRNTSPSRATTQRPSSVELVNRAPEGLRRRGTVIDMREESMKAFRAVPIVARALVQGQDDATLRSRPAPGEWAAVEVIVHMADTDERALERIRRMRDEDEPALAAFDPGALAVELDYIAAPIEPTLKRLEHIIETLLADLRTMDDANWQRIGRHIEHGWVSIALYLAHVASEDVDHLAQLARLRSTS